MVIVATVLAHSVPVQAQLTRLDTVLAGILNVESQHDTALTLHTDACRIVGDSSLLPLLNHVGEPAVEGVPTFVLDQLSATVRDSSTVSRMDVSMSGRLVPAGGLATSYRTRSVSRILLLSPADRADLETNRSRYVHLERETPKSFWETTLEPALVVLGAAVIVALFFLIRS